MSSTVNNNYKVKYEPKYLDQAMDIALANPHKYRTVEKVQRLARRLQKEAALAVNPEPAYTAQALKLSGEYASCQAVRKLAHKLQRRAEKACVVVAANTDNKAPVSTEGKASQAGN